jgi:hypothetical protein
MKTAIFTYYCYYYHHHRHHHYQVQWSVRYLSGTTDDFGSCSHRSNNGCSCGIFDTNINGLMLLVTSGKSTELPSNVNKLPVIEER